MLVAGLANVVSADEPVALEVTTLGVGGVLITDANVSGRRQVASLISGLRAASGTPLLVVTEEEPGRASSFAAVLGSSSSARSIAANEDVEGVREFARELAVELRGFGVDLDLAPVADLDDGPTSGIIGDRSFSADADTAASAALAYAEGIARGGLLPAVKHWPGRGRSSTGSDSELEVVEATMDELRATDLRRFQALIDAGVPVVMLAHIGYTAFASDLPASLTPAAYTELRDSGFTGVALTSDLSLGAVASSWPAPEAAVLALEAGADAVLVTQGEMARPKRDAIVASIRSGRVPESRLDEAVARVLALKGADPRTLTCTDAAVPEMGSPAAGDGPAPSVGGTPTPTATPRPSPPSGPSGAPSEGDDRG